MRDQSQVIDEHSPRSGNRVIEDPHDRMLDKLRKILERSKSPNEGEAGLAAEMLQRFLLAHNLSVADLEKRGGHAAPSVEKRGHDLGKAAFKWKLDLAEAVAHYYYCEPLIDRHTKTVAFVGRPDNVEALQMLYAWIMEQIKAISKETRRAHFDETGEHIDPLRWQVSFGLGAVERLEVRLREIRARRDEDAADGVREAEQSVALVTNLAKENSDWLEENYGYRTDGRLTKKRQKEKEEWEKEEARLEALKETDLEAYYEERPWDRPETPEQAAEREKADAAYWKKEEAKARRRANYIPTGGYRERKTDERKEDQSERAESAGRKAASKINVQPFLGSGRKSKGEVK